MTLLELARRWLKPGAKAETQDEASQELEFRELAATVWLAYHDNEPWAQRKLEAGLNLTPEALQYMEREVLARAAAEAHRKKLTENENDSSTDKLKVAPDAGSQHPGNSERDGSGGAERGESRGGAVQSEGGRLDQSEPEQGARAGEQG